MILAAGAGSRMGALKQLLPFRGGTLLSNAIAQAKEAGFARIAVVIGADAIRVAEAMTGEQIETVENPGWDSGMGSSIRAGMAHMRMHGTLPEVLAILLADQPFVRSTHLMAMRRLQAESGGTIVAAEYDGCHGVPALFTPALFAMLENLAPEAGARQLLRDGRFPVTSYPLPEAATDVDTPGDFAALEAMRP
jgi:molybdenum cofactor cytidylyltransferase